jgi:hypothetical protein
MHSTNALVSDFEGESTERHKFKVNNQIGNQGHDTDVSYGPLTYTFFSRESA